MGYRLEISKIEHVYCGGKLYGYVPEEQLKQLKSYQWLLKHGWIDNDSVFDYGFNPCIQLNPVDFRQFMKLYMADKGCEIDPQLEELMASDGYKLLDWY